MKDIKPLLLIVLSAGLVGTWFYHLYDKSHYASLSAVQKVDTLYVRDTIANARQVRDSLQNLFNVSVKEMDEDHGDIDSLRSQLSQRVAEINQLKSRIGSILKKQNLTSGDLKDARNLIRDLRYKIEEMDGQYSSLEQERQRLSSVMDQLNGKVDSLQNDIRKMDDENKKLARQVSDASLFVASDISFKAVNVKGSGNKEVDTRSANKAKKLIISFNLQNNVMNFPNAELTIVVLDTKGKTIMEDMWGSGQFDTKAEGKKEFTRKIRFDYNKGDSKNILFSLTPEDFSSGTYQLLIYHNGIRIGRSALSLS